MATYNGEKYIKEQLASIVCQLDENDEIIVSDDNSIDDTLRIIKSFNDNRIKVFYNDKGKGYASNFENALEKSAGDIIFMSDQDDVWKTNKVELSLKYLDSCDFVVSDCTVVDGDLEVLHSSHFKLRDVQKGFLRNLLLPRYVGACMAFKRNVLERSLPFPKNKTLCAHDYWICLIAELYFKTNLIDKSLLLYRRHGNNASTGGDKSRNSLFRKVMIRIYTSLHIFRVLHNNRCM